jgi:hypothetical protein
MVEKEIPCDKCITKAICFNKVYVKCFLLADFLRRNLGQFKITSLSYPQEYKIKKFNMEIFIYDDDHILVWSRLYNSHLMSIKHLYETLQKALVTNM